MEKAHQMAERAAHNFGNGKRLKWQINRSLKEGFSCKYAGGEYSLEASSPSAAIYAIDQLKIGLASGHAGEFLGEWHPRFPLRPLWMHSDVEIALKPGISVHIPSCFVNGVSDAFCERVLQLGYNAILMGCWQESDKPSHKASPETLTNVCTTLRSFGLKVIVKPHLKHSSFEELSLNVDGIFWENNCLKPGHPLVRDATDADLVRAELHLVQQIVDQKKLLIYYIPTADSTMASRQAAWLPALCDEMRENAILAFPAVSGGLFEDHLPPHPFWEALRKSPDVSTTPLMPIINIGSVKQGEGLWPTLPLDLLQKYIGGCHRHNFAGAIGLVNQIHDNRPFLNCSLWTAAQMMWRGGSAPHLAETWFLAGQPKYHFSDMSKAYAAVRELIVQASLLRSLEENPDQLTQEECRSMIDSMLMQLKHLQMQFEKRSLNDYFVPFMRDIRLITLRACQSMQMPLLHLKKEEDVHGGVWVQGLSGEMGKFLEHPVLKI